MRVFIAAEIPEKIREYLYSVPLYFRAIKGVNWVPKENLHVTLAFLGETGEENLEEICRKTEAVAEKFKAFECSLGKIEAVPAKLPRLVWVSLKDGKRLGEIHEELKKTLNLKDREFSGHVTLGRIKASASAKEISKKGGKIAILPLTFRVEHISIMRSVLTPHGAVYSVIKKINLRRA